MAWQVYQLTGSALDLGLVGLFQFLPRIALTPFAGHLADRHNRRRIAVIAQTVQALVLIVLCAASFEHLATRELLFILVFISGAARTYEGPATQAMLPAVVPLSMFARAVAVNASAIQAATLIAPAVAGGLYIVGATAAYGVTAALYAAAALAMQAVPFKAQPVGASSGFVASFVEGLRFMRGRPIILGAISLDMFAVLLGGATALLPIYARDILMTGPWGLGLLWAVQFCGLVWLWRGYRLGLKKQFAAAIPFLKNAIAAAGDSGGSWVFGVDEWKYDAPSPESLALLLLAECYQHASASEEATATLQSALNSLPKNNVILYRKTRTANGTTESQEYTLTSDVVESRLKNPQAGWALGRREEISDGRRGSSSNWGPQTVESLFQ